MRKRFTIIMNISEKNAIEVAKTGEDIRRMSLYVFDAQESLLMQHPLLYQVTDEVHEELGEIGRLIEDYGDVGERLIKFYKEHQGVRGK